MIEAARSEYQVFKSPAKRKSSPGDMELLTMGFDTYIAVDDVILVQYRKQTGDLPRFLFTRDELRIRTSSGPNARPVEVEFRSTAATVLRNLEEQGLGWDATVAAYATIRDGWYAEAVLTGRYLAEAEIAAERRGARATETDYAQVEDRIETQRASSPAGDLSSLGALLAKQWLDPGDDEVFLLSDVAYDQAIEGSSTIVGDAIRAADEFGQPPLPAARATQTLVNLFRDAPLLAWPMLVTVLLQHLPEDTSVCYVLTDGIDEFSMHDVRATNSFVDQYWSHAGAQIATYARNLGVLFGTLADFDTRLGPQYWFGRASAALSQLDQLNQDREASTSKARGDALERLVESLFNTEAPQLQVTEKNFSTREEEIDLVLRNNLPDPFWVSQHSPYIFVECKNWASPVGVAELRTFESKLDDRRGIVRIGIFVSSSGYYKTFVDRLKVIQTKNIGLVYAVTLADIRALINRRERLSDWLLGAGAMRAFDAHAIAE